MTNEDENEKAGEHTRQANAAHARAEPIREAPRVPAGSSVLLLVLGQAPRGTRKAAQITTLEDVTPRPSPENQT